MYQAQQTYLENEILQADPLELVRILYRAALEAVGKARIHLRSNEIKERSRQITKAGAIINELALSVDRERGGEIARNLVELYDYMQRCLQEANFQQSDAPLAELEKLLGTLLEAWENCMPAPPPAAAASGLGMPLSLSC